MLHTHDPAIPNCYHSSIVKLDVKIDLGCVCVISGGKMIYDGR